MKYYRLYCKNFKLNIQEDKEVDFATSCTSATFCLYVSLAWSCKNTIDAARENDSTDTRRSA